MIITINNSSMWLEKIIVNKIFNKQFWFRTLLGTHKFMLEVTTVGSSIIYSQK